MGRQQKEQPIAAEAAAKVTKGMAKAQVLEILGAPQDIKYVRRENDPVRDHAYVYEHITTKYTGISFAFINFGNADEKHDRVVVFFDDKDQVSAVGTSLYADQSSYGFPFGK
jgi:outer membrane protein assembly factor BamE (lipoprotein component of BamABCDE complex)